MKDFTEQELLNDSNWYKISKGLYLLYPSKVKAGLIMKWMTISDISDRRVFCNICNEVALTAPIGSVLEIRMHGYEHFKKLEHLLPFI